MSTRPTAIVLKNLSFLELLLMVISDDHRSFRQCYIDELYKRGLSRRPELLDLIAILRADPSIGDKTEPTSEEVAQDHLLMRADGSFKPVPRDFDEPEAPLYWYAKAILSSGWPGADLGSYSAKDVLHFVRDVAEVIKPSKTGEFQSDPQERMFKSVIGKFNDWARKNLTLMPA